MMTAQLGYFLEDYKRATGKYWFRGFYIWMKYTIIGILFYRIERSLYMLFGEYYRILRVLFMPLIFLVEALSRVDINYRADIKGGLCILHGSMGVVINGGAIIGRNLTLVGGNVIGGNHSFPRGGFTVGDNCFMGANAVMIGPIHVGDNVIIGASACVVKDIPSNVSVAGVPAKNIHENQE